MTHCDVVWACRHAYRPNRGDASEPWLHQLLPHRQGGRRHQDLRVRGLLAVASGEMLTTGALCRYEASHGTVADLYAAHLRGEETSFNPLGLVEALMGAMEHSASLYSGEVKDCDKVVGFTRTLRKHIHHAFVSGHGTRDLCGPSGLTTEQFVEHVGRKLSNSLKGVSDSDSDDEAHFVPDPVVRTPLLLELPPGHDTSPARDMCYVAA